MRDFDEMMQLYIDNPEAFEKERQEVIESFIESVPEGCREHLRQKQWKIDGELRIIKDPVAKMNRMVELFWDGFKEFQDALNHCAKGEAIPPKKILPTNPSILPFTAKADSKDKIV